MYSAQVGMKLEINYRRKLDNSQICENTKHASEQAMGQRRNLKRN